MGNILVLNMGMKSIRSVIFSQNGDKLSFSNRPLATSLTEVRVEQDPYEWWEKAAEVIHDTLIDVDKKSIEFITVTSSSSCLVCCDNDNKPLMRCIMVSDKRAENESEFLSSTPEFEKIKKETGTDMNPGMMLPKILWVKNNLPEVFCNTKHFLAPNDYLIAKMTGKYVTDTFNAMKFHYDSKTKKYPMSLLNIIGGGGSRQTTRST